MFSRLKHSINCFLPTKTFVFVLCFSIFSCIMFAHVYDPYALIKWWTILIDCILDNNISDYQHILTDLTIETNYPLLLNILFSIIMLPIYGVLHLFSAESHLWLYILYLKVIIIICNFACAKIIQLILAENKIEEGKQKVVSLIFLLSPFVQFYSIGMGQIDAIGLLAGLLCFLAFQKKKNIQFIIFAVISVQLKPFIVFILAPLLIAMWHRKKIIALLSGVLLIGCYFLQSFLADLIITDYSKGSGFWNYFIFFPRIMKYQIFGIPIVITLIVLICLFFFIWGYFREINLFSILFVQTLLLIVFEGLVTQHPQWFIYFGAVSTMLLAFSNRKSSCILYLLLEFIYCINGVFWYDEGYIATSYGDSGFLGKFFNYGGFLGAHNIYEEYPLACEATSILLTIVSFIYIFIIIWSHYKDTPKKTDAKLNPTNIILTSLPSICLSLFVIIGYLWQV